MIDLEPPYLNLVLHLLNAHSLDIIQEGYGLFDLDDSEQEELYNLPPECTMILEFNDVRTPSTSYGYVALMEFRGRRFVAEQNASPFMIYYI